MTWRLEIKHSTKFQYESTVEASFNEARMSPQTNPHQTLLKHEFNVSPKASLFQYTDYFDTYVTAFDVQTEHDSLSIVSSSTVDSNVPPDSGESISWDNLSSETIKDEFSEYLAFSELVDPIDSNLNLKDVASPRMAITLLNDEIRKYIVYTSGATHVYSPASEAWAKGAGVCQDFTHTSLSLLRAANIPARYVSGYLYTGSGEIGEKVIGESHSWVEAWVGEWIQFDPTNGRDVSEDHVLVARGRDYHDVSPLKGIYSGGQSRNIEVSVELTRIAR